MENINTYSPTSPNIEYCPPVFKTNFYSEILNKEMDSNVVLDLENHKYILKENPSTHLHPVTHILTNRIYNAFDIAVSSKKPQTYLYKINKEIKKPMRYEAVMAEWEFSKQIGVYFHDTVETYLVTREEQNKKRDDKTEPPSKKRHIDDIHETIFQRIFYHIQNYDPSKLKKSWDFEEVKEFVIDEYHQDRLSKNLFDRMNAFDKVYNLIFRHLELIATEYIIYDELHEIAGSIDALFWHNKAQREVVIVDWKTCSNYSFFGSKVTNASSPFFNYKKTKLDKYFCQLHIYSKILMKNYNVTVVGLYIVFFSTNKSFVIHHKENDISCPCISAIFIE